MPGFCRICPPPKPEPWSWKRELEGLAACFVFGVLPLLLLCIVASVLVEPRATPNPCLSPTPEAAQK